MKPLVLMNVVGLTPALLPHAPNLAKLRHRPMGGVFPAVTMTAQATMLSGLMPAKHGVVGNTWYWRPLGEVRNWVQSNALLHEPLYRTAATIARQHSESFSCAKMFWWFNQGSGCDFSATPKPHYGSDGSKEFDIQTMPDDLALELKAEMGPFPFQAFWGPRAGLQSSDWIARATAFVMRRKHPTLTLCYLPHLDYDLQRFGDAADVKRLVREVDDCARLVLEAAAEQGASVLVVSEYGIRPVSQPVYLNRELRRAGMLRVRRGPYGEMLDTHDSRAFAVCDHQCAHIYIRDEGDVPRIAEILGALHGVGRVLNRQQQQELAIDHPNSGELVLLSQPESWFAYPYWLDDDFAPDFARSVDIHRKPGYDPCELFMAGSNAGAGATLIRKKLGLRYRFRTCPLDASIVKGSHGLPPTDPSQGALVASTEPLPDTVQMHEIKQLALRMMGMA